MGRRRWKCAAKVTSRKGFQRKRSRSHRREFVRGGADPIIRRYEIGNIKQREWDVTLGLIILTKRKISHFTLEAMRRIINRRMQKQVGRMNFYARIRVHPHYVYREHAQMAFAGADRISSGMRNAFGKTVGRCAVVKAGQVILEVSTHFQHFEKAKEAIRIAGYRIGAKHRTVLLDARDPSMRPKITVPPIEQFQY